MSNPSAPSPAAFEKIEEGSKIAQISVPAIGAAIKPLGQTLPLKEALKLAEAAAVKLSLNDRKTIVEQTLRAIEDIYAHLFLKRARHAFDPVAALKRLKRRVDTYENDFEFHMEMLRILKQLRDIHTGYILPSPYDQMVAFLPFTLVRCSDDPAPGGPRHVIVAGVLPGVDHDSFKPGVRLIGWNGIPIDDALDHLGADQHGANADARMAYGTMLMTIRWLGGSIPPKELWVTLAYEDEGGALREIRFPWKVLILPGTDDPVAQAFPPLQALADLNGHLNKLPAGPVSVERRALTGRSVARLLYRKPDDRKSAKSTKTTGTGTGTLTRTPIQMTYPDTIFAETIAAEIDGKRYDFGRIHLHHFIYPDGDEYLADFLNALGQMPKTGLVLDLRGNGGGDITTAERLVQVISAHIDTRPLPFQFRATPIVAHLASTKTFAADPAELPGWEGRVRPLIDDAVQFSLNGYMTTPEQIAAVPKKQRYGGPVVLLTDAMTYSAGDMFAASFQDHKLGPVVGVDTHTGGGGANLWFHQSTVAYAEDSDLFCNLPGGAQLHYATRRCLRMGAQNAGLPFEEDGVRPDVLRALTRTDLTDHAHDLLVFAAQTYLPTT